MLDKLKFKNVLIAGGTSGVGLALAQKALAEGANVHIVGRSAEKLRAIEAELDNWAVVTHQIDISDEAQVRALAKKIPALDHLITTAAELSFGPFLELSKKDMERTIATKFWGAVNLVRHFGSKISPHGSITFYSGAAAYKASAGASIVAAANAALEGLARTLAVEMAPIRVNVVSPGVFDSPTWNFIPEEARRQTMDTIGKSLLTGRVGTVDELADAGMFVIGNGFTTGTVLQIDGGANA